MLSQYEVFSHNPMTPNLAPHMPSMQDIPCPNLHSEPLHQLLEDSIPITIPYKSYSSNNCNSRADNVEPTVSHVIFSPQNLLHAQQLLHLSIASSPPTCSNPTKLSILYNAHSSKGLPL